MYYNKFSLIICTLIVYYFYFSSFLSFFFFFNDTATTEIYTLSLHDALPISPDFLAAGMFIGHDGPALLAAARGGNAIYVMARDASGDFQLRQTIPVTGSITVLRAFQLTAGQYIQVVAGIHDVTGSSLQLYI